MSTLAGSKGTKISLFPGYSAVCFSLMSIFTGVICDTRHMGVLIVPSGGSKGMERYARDITTVAQVNVVHINCQVPRNGIYAGSETGLREFTVRFCAEIEIDHRSSLSMYLPRTLQCL